MPKKNPSTKRTLVTSAKASHVKPVENKGQANFADAEEDDFDIQMDGLVGIDDFNSFDDDDDDY